MTDPEMAVLDITGYGRIEYDGGYVTHKFYLEGKNVEDDSNNRVLMVITQNGCLIEDGVKLYQLVLRQTPQIWAPWLGWVDGVQPRIGSALCYYEDICFQRVIEVADEPYLETLQELVYEDAFAPPVVVTHQCSEYARQLNDGTFEFLFAGTVEVHGSDGQAIEEGCVEEYIGLVIDPNMLVVYGF